MTSTVRTGRTVELVDLSPEHLRVLWRELTAPDVAATWRLRDRTRSPEAVERALLVDAAMSAVVIDRRSGAVLGLVELVSLDVDDRHAELSLVVFGPHRQTGVALEAAALFLDEAFHRFGLRKIYALIPSRNAAQLLAGLRRLEATGIGRIEGQLRQHLWLAGAWEDLTVWSILRTELARARVAGHPLGLLAADEWRTAEGEAA